jgi:hypothetical protein
MEDEDEDEDEEDIQDDFDSDSNNPASSLEHKVANGGETSSASGQKGKVSNKTEDILDEVAPFSKKDAKTVSVAQGRNEREQFNAVIRNMYGQPVHSNFTDVPGAKGIEAANTIAALAAELKSIHVKGSRLQMNRPDTNKFVNCPLVMSIVLAKFKR